VQLSQNNCANLCPYEKVKNEEVVLILWELRTQKAETAQTSAITCREFLSAFSAPMATFTALRRSLSAV
jgi:hypothetical protein